MHFYLPRFLLHVSSKMVVNTNGMMDPFAMKTIDSDDELPQEESEDEEEKNMKSKKKKKKSKGRNEITTDFNGDFSFSVETNEQSKPTWKIADSVTKSAKGRISSSMIEGKIKKLRADRKKSNAKTVVKVENEELNEASTENGHNKDEEDDTIENDDRECEVSTMNEKKNGDIIDEASSEDDDDSECEEEEPFFEKPPPQVHHETFGQMNLSRPLMRAINELGYLHPTPIQSATIPIALLGKDICACAATGTGKTAAFVLPIIERLLFRPMNVPVTRVLILIPTRELAIQVHAVSTALAKYTNIQICLATGGLESRSQEAALRKNPDIIVATPGRLIDHLHNAMSFDIQSVEILVLDEADRMLEEHFKDQMDEIIRLSPRGRQTMLFSATMTDEVQELASLSLNQPIRLFVDQNTDVAMNLQQEFVRIRPNREGDRIALIAALCCRSFSDHCLVFLQTKLLAHRLRIVLGLMGLNVGELHGNLTQLQRLEALQQFKDEQISILVATDLAARGLDISGVKTVLSFNMPTTIKSYIHRVGRTARAGKSGRSITLVGEKERKMLKEVAKTSRVPLKNRVIPTEIVDKYVQKIRNLDNDVKLLLKEELEEKEFRISEMEMNKAKNMIIHRDEIMSRPARTFIKDTTSKKLNPVKPKKKKEVSEEEQKQVKEMKFFKMQARKAKRPKRMRATAETEKPAGPPAKKNKSSAMKSAFQRELTDTSKKALKEFRFGEKTSNNSAKKKAGKFKSKKKFKRR